VHAVRRSTIFPRGALAIAALVTLLPAPALSAQVYRIDSQRTSVAFEVTEFGLWLAYGRFGRTDGRIDYDTVAEKGNVELAVDAGSVQTGWDLRDRFVRGENMLDAAHHPVLRFRSTGMTFVAHRLVAVDGELTLHGVTLPVRLDVRNVRCGRSNAEEGSERCDAEIVGRISRHAFGMDFASPLVSDEVLLTFAVSASRVDGTEARP
jgi:polyisoprenoid-binding protein YceI